MFRLDEGQIEVLDDAVAEILRKKTSEEKLKIASDMWRSAKVQIEASLGSIHKDWSKEQIEREVIRRLSHGIDAIQGIEKFWGEKKVEDIHAEIMEAKRKGLIFANDGKHT